MTVSTLNSKEIHSFPLQRSPIDIDVYGTLSRFGSLAERSIGIYCGYDSRYIAVITIIKVGYQFLQN